MNIYLYGIFGVYNYGCEAMVRAISARFKEIDPNDHIIYKTMDYTNDSRILKDCETVELSPAVSKYENVSGFRRFFMRANSFARKKLNISKAEDWFSFRLDWIDNCDVLVIIGGDVFDIVPSKKNKKYRNNRILLSELVKKRGGKVLLWGISVGDFESDPEAKRVLVDYFKNTVDYAIIRDKNSYEYLRTQGVSNIKNCPDPAYMLRTLQKTVEDKEKVLGINLSPLCNRYLKANLTEDEWLELWTERIEALFHRVQYDRIMLIPHVVNKNKPKDDDMAYLSKLYAKMETRKLPVWLVSEDRGFLSVKNELTQCSLILAARMHCAVNSVTCGVPIVFLSYSPKSVGMCRNVYGNEDMVIDLNELQRNPNCFFEKVSRIAEESETVQAYLSERNKQLYDESVAAAKTLEAVLKENSK